jgi:alanine racemase
MKKLFQDVGWQLRDRLMNESILCMNGTLQTVYDQQNEINRLRKVVNSMKSMDNVDFSNAIEGTV